MKLPPTDKPELLRWLRMQGDADRRILAHLWDLPPHSEPEALAAALTEPGRVRAQWDRLADAERAALTRVLQEGGALPAAILQREWGAIREPRGFANPRAYLQALEAPASPAERLYTMGLLVRDHDDRGQVFRILNDFRALLPDVEPRDRALRVDPVPEPAVVELADPEETDRTVLAFLELAYDGALKTLDDGALNKASLTRLAKRLYPDARLSGVRRESEWPWIALIRAVVVEAGLLQRTTDGLLHVAPAATAWLKADRPERLRTMLRGWIASQFNELSTFCGITWRSRPLDLRLPESRRTLLDLLRSLPAGKWLSVDAIAAEVERVEPDFLRRNGRYDLWLLYNRRGEYVASREDWHKVEGMLIAAVLVALLRWLGLVDAAGKDKQLDLVRLTPLAAHLLQDAAPPPAPAPEPLAVQGTFEVICPPGASLWARFQLTRIAEPVKDDAAAIFRLSRRSILQAAERGIDAEQALQFLAENGRGPVPQAVATYLREWSGQAGHLMVEQSALLRADDPVRLAEVRRARGIALPPIEELTPTTWKVEPGDVPGMLQQLQRAGFSVDAGAWQAQPGRATGAGLLSEHDLKALVTAAFAYARLCAEHDLPCEVSSSMLMRLQKLAPSRHVDAALRKAAELSARVQTDRGGEEQPDVDAPYRPGAERYA